MDLILVAKMVSFTHFVGFRLTFRNSVKYIWRIKYLRHFKYVKDKNLKRKEGFCHCDLL